MPATRSPARQPRDDFAEDVFALTDHGDIDRRLLQTLFGKQRRMPTAPDHGASRVRLLHRSRHQEGIVYRRTGQHGDADTDGIPGGGDDGRDGIRLEPPVNDDDLDAVFVGAPIRAR